MTLVTVNPHFLPRQDTPPEEGRYVVFVRCESYQVKDWLEPEIATWAGGRWHNRRHVFAWFGPLPLCKWADFKGERTWDEIFADKQRVEGGWRDKPAQEYDL